MLNDSYLVGDFSLATYPTEVIEAFKMVSTATLATVLLKKGLRNIWLRGPFPLSGNQSRAIGPAFTMRFIPAREDLATPASWASPTSNRIAIEQMTEGYIAVVTAGRRSNAGVFGDILCRRLKQRNVAVMITDGVVRALGGVLASGLGVGRSEHLRRPRWLV